MGPLKYTSAHFHTNQSVPNVLYRSIKIMFLNSFVKVMKKNGNKCSCFAFSKSNHWNISTFFPKDETGENKYSNRGLVINQVNKIIIKKLTFMWVMKKRAKHFYHWSRAFTHRHGMHLPRAPILSGSQSPECV